MKHGHGASPIAARTPCRAPRSAWSGRGAPPATARSSGHGAVALATGHPRDRLVQEQELRLLADQHPDLKPLLLAVGQPDGPCRRARPPARSAGASRPRDRGSAASIALHAPRMPPCDPTAISMFCQTVRFGKMVGVWNLRPMPYRAISCSWRRVRSWFSKRAVPESWPGLAGDDVQQGRLAGPVRPDQEAHLAARQRQAQVVEHGQAVEADRDLA